MYGCKFASRRCGVAACGRFYHADCMNLTKEDIDGAYLWYALSCPLTVSYAHSFAHQLLAMPISFADTVMTLERLLVQVAGEGAGTSTELQCESCL